MIRLSSIRTAFRGGGLQEVLWRAYNQTRHATPDLGPVLFNGIPTGARRHLLDLVAPHKWTSDVCSNATYESALVAGLRMHVGPGEHVVVVGGGHGVTAAVAAIAAGPSGRVDVYEAGDDMLDGIRQTLAANGVGAHVHHAVVGAAHAVYGETTARVVPPGELPPCDVLMLDCEGAEREILTDLAARPRVLLIETHGMYGAPTADVRRIVEALGYRITGDEIAEAGLADMCEQLDVRVLTALHDAPASTS